MWGKQIFARAVENPKRKLGVTMHFSEIIKGHVNLQNANFSGHIVIKYTFSVCRICYSFFKASAFSVGKGRCKFEAPAILITPSFP